MEYILLGAIIIGTVINYFINKHFTLQISRLFSSYRTETFKFSETQKQNTEELVKLLNRLFITSDNQIKSEPNEVTKVNEDEIDFSEQNPITLPKDIKFEVEGGDSFIPPGYSQKGVEA